MAVIGRWGCVFVRNRILNFLLGKSAGPRVEPASIGLPSLRPTFSQAVRRNGFQLFLNRAVKKMVLSGLQIEKHSLMRRLLLLFFTLGAFASCDYGTPESDARRLAELRCRSQRMAREAGLSPDHATKHLTLQEASRQLDAEADEMARLFAQRYRNEEENRRFAEAFLKAYEACR